MPELRFPRRAPSSAPAPRTDETPRPPAARSDVISCRATNPLSIHDDVSKVFIDERQAKATTATRLFRNEELFSALRDKAMPSYFRQSALSRRPFVIWSSGCSSGEEVYSLAMVALGEFAGKGTAPNLDAFGTDINRERLALARAGCYGMPSRQAIGEAYWALLLRHARLEGASVRMGDDLRARCRFGVFDMRQRPKKHTFDFIVCNHVLQYYDPPGQLHILRNLQEVLKPGGHLYLEGITDGARSAMKLQKIEGQPNLFVPAPLHPH